ncbi:MAG: hypothetical protein IT364_15805 [Candidatus Hydrogenedentes bacterium]|nr:hypothetical protein [Candidatus Hydrogenedentota bacterium]
MNALLFLLAAAAATLPEGVNAWVIVDPPVIPFHRQTTFSITVEAPEGMEVELPRMVGKIGGLDIYGEPAFTTEPLDGGRKRVTQTYVLDPIFAGVYPIEPVTVTLNKTESIQIPAPAIQIRELTEAEEAEAMKFVPNAGPTDIERSLVQRWEVWVIAALAAAAVLFALFWYLRKKRFVKRLVPPPSPWDIAYARLRELDAKKWPQAGRYQPYYVELSSILRHYIEDRFTLHAPERTTPEFLTEASSSGLLSEDHQMLLAHFLRHCDRVKFAMFEPSIGDMERSFSEVLRFVDETVPTPATGEARAA